MLLSYCLMLLVFPLCYPLLILLVLAGRLKQFDYLFNNRLCLVFPVKEERIIGAAFYGPVVEPAAIVGDTPCANAVDMLLVFPDFSVASPKFIFRLTEA